MVAIDAALSSTTLPAPLAPVRTTRRLDGKLSSGFIGWLKSNFGWLFSPGQAGKSRTGLAFVYDENANLLAAYGNGSNTASQQQMEFIWLPLEDGSAIPVGIYKNGQLYAVHTDHLGTPRLITDGAKAPVWQWPYSAFGSNKPTGVLKAVSTMTAAGTATQLKATATAFDMNLRFRGQYWDGESNLAYNYFRMYCPRCGRFTQFDPTGLNGGLNGFGYANADPLRRTDPRGLAALTISLPEIPLPEALKLPASSVIAEIALILSLSGDTPKPKVEDIIDETPVPPWPGLTSLSKCTKGRVVIEPAMDKRWRAGGVSIEQEYKCDCGQITRHSVVFQGAVVHDHFRPGAPKGGGGD